MSYATELAVKLWSKAYEAKPRQTTILSILALIISAIPIVYELTYGEAARERELEESLVLQNQIQSLNQMEESARDLILFVERQRSQLREAEQVVQQLREEQETLEPVVSADREAVEALFALQEQRSESRVGRERWIGFGLGVLASIIASVIGGIIRYLVNKRSATKSLPVDPAV